MFSTYDHRKLNSALPVRSAVLKQFTGGLVVRWVTTGESPLLYVFEFLDIHECMSAISDLITSRLGDIDVRIDRDPYFSHNWSISQSHSGYH
jgi:hypothetical protein